MYSVIDIEATGGNAKNGKITEIAIYKFDGEKVIDEFSSLINPQMSIPKYVQKLTGINNQMVAKAPTFSDLAEKILRFTTNSCFVAHNADADFSFVHSEMKNAGFEFNNDRLCTLELSRQLIEDAPSHGLANICKHLNIQIENRHRASGDAYATVELFKHLLYLDSFGLVQKIQKKANGTRIK